MRVCINLLFFFFSSRRRHTRLVSDWSSDVCSSDLSREHQRAEPVGCRFRGSRPSGGPRAIWLPFRAPFLRRDGREGGGIRRRPGGEHACDDLGIEFDPDTAWDERENLFKMSGKIVRTSNITQSAIGNKDGLWTTVFSACVFVNDDNN